jgi:hypothetical protein
METTIAGQLDIFWEDVSATLYMAMRARRNEVAMRAVAGGSMNIGDAIMFISNDDTPTEVILYWERRLSIRPDRLH